jgi:dihydrofolate reductase
MGLLNYTALTSLDGLVADTQGNFDWAMPPEDVHSWVNQQESHHSTVLYGRKMWEIMAVWETFGGETPLPKVYQEFQDLWRRTDKIVFSRTWTSLSAPRTRLCREFTPAWLENLKATSPGGLGIGGAELASQALEWGLVDEVCRFVFPVVVGAGRPWVAAKATVPLRLVETREFSEGVVLLRYRAGL